MTLGLRTAVAAALFVISLAVPACTPPPPVPNPHPPVQCAATSVSMRAEPGLTDSPQNVDLSFSESVEASCDNGLTMRIAAPDLSLPGLTCFTTDIAAAGVGQINWSDGTDSALDLAVVLYPPGSASYVTAHVTSGRLAGYYAAARLDVASVGGSCAAPGGLTDFHVSVTPLSFNHP